MGRHAQIVNEFTENGRNGVVKDVFQEPGQTHGLIVGRGLGVVDEGGFAQLQYQLVDRREVVETDGFFQIVDDAQHLARIKLRRVGR